VILFVKIKAPIGRFIPLSPQDGEELAFPGERD
jgi:hypothetical protein